MTLDEAIEKFEKQEKVAQIMLTAEYGTLPGVRDHVHQERKELAEWALKGLRRLKGQEGRTVKHMTSFDLRYAPQGMTEEELIELARKCAADDIAQLLLRNGVFYIDRESNCVRGIIRVEAE